jgi:hypothetical protein
MPPPDWQYAPRLVEEPQQRSSLPQIPWLLHLEVTQRASLAFLELFRSWHPTRYAVRRKFLNENFQQGSHQGLPLMPNKRASPIFLSSIKIDLVVDIFENIMYQGCIQNV